MCKNLRLLSAGFGLTAQYTELIFASKLLTVGIGTHITPAAALIVRTKSLLCRWPSASPLLPSLCFLLQMPVHGSQDLERKIQQERDGRDGEPAGELLVDQERWDEIMGQVWTGCKEHKCWSRAWEELSWDLQVRICLHPRDEHCKQLLSLSRLSPALPLF